MGKVTSKYQVTVPKAIADLYRIRPGDEIDWVAAGEVIRVVPRVKQVTVPDRQAKLRLFDEATQRAQERGGRSGEQKVKDRGWKREDLYSRGRAD